MDRQVKEEESERGKDRRVLSCPTKVIESNMTILLRRSADGLSAVSHRDGVALEIHSARFNLILALRKGSIIIPADTCIPTGLPPDLEKKSARTRCLFDKQQMYSLL